MPSVGPSVGTDPLASLDELPGVFEAADSARAAIDGLLREPVLRRGRGEIRAASRRRAAWASARLEGAMVSLEEFEPPFAEDRAGRLCAGSLRISGEVRALADTWRRAPLQALARLHTLAAADVVAPDALGRPRPDPGVAARLTVIADMVTSTSASGVVVAAVVQGELLDVAPFGWGDGLVARAASRLVLVARGVDPDALTVPEEGLLVLGQEPYATALAAYQTGTPEGVATWLIHIAASVQQGATIARELTKT